MHVKAANTEIIIFTGYVVSSGPCTGHAQNPKLSHVFFFYHYMGITNPTLGFLQY